MEKLTALVEALTQLLLAVALVLYQCNVMQGLA